MEPDPPNDHERASPRVKSVDEGELRRTLDSGMGISVGAIGRPATVVFKSDIESTSVYVDKQGNVSVSRGALPDPDILIEGDHATLCAILQMLEPTLAAPGNLTITVNTATIKDFVIEIPEGREMVHPLKELHE